MVLRVFRKVKRKRACVARGGKFLCASTLLLAMNACTPMSETEKEYLDAERQKKEELETFEQNMTQQAKISQVIEKVQSWKQEDGRTAEQYANVQKDTAEGQAMMGQWNAAQKGDKLYEVTFRFLLVDQLYNKQRIGFRWMLDENLDRITGPKEIETEQVRSRNEKESQTRNLRSRDPWSLE